MMGFSILSIDQISVIASSVKMSRIDELEDLIEAQKKHTLQQVYDWGDRWCNHDIHPYSKKRHECYQCWAELKKEIE